jgi:TonB family protein
MRSLFTFLFLIFLAVTNGVAQVRHALYYDADMKVIDDVKSAQFLEIIERESDEVENGVIKFYKIMPNSDNYELVKMGTYASVFHPRKAHGQVISYFPDGKRKGLQTYTDGVLHGLDIEWHENDSLKHTIGYKQGKYDGELKTFYSSGKLKREELYKDGEQVYGKCYTEDGKESPFVAYREMPLYPGGEKAMLTYLGQNIRYPANSQRSGASGIVVVKFVVNKYGAIENLRLLKGVNDELNKEAMRVVRNMKAWQPATLEGEKISEEYVVPIKFSIR